ncbi:hypothetical protein PGT21_017606 [Puccinia graminis f. sp. tritici]|uniref:Uncharacterized protein n=2 Tax=Puccinia graminis f. sp. tritici TaxID=56615 RepID=E3K1B5_PUCGT|nr:uncharacterized protein PGTG_04046 [Puccinia graminis f. sp. tritici CRL 75-36-700-3]EFP78090.2 hypothetical protein PGTG_04046 [Puccinia graminis f. sp. tritici CRL 75-36-700-3]KAA1112982.1 hypothetical protein PGT21_017606 [Puccinia graminis f. sp. tritici]
MAPLLLVLVYGFWGTSNSRSEVELSCPRIRLVSGGVNPEAATQYFDSDIEKELAQLENHIIKWEVARSIFSYPVEDQRKVLASDLPSDPCDLNLTSIVPGCGVDYDYDTQMSSVIDQIKQEMKSEENPSDGSPIQRLVRSGDVRFAIDLSLSETGWRSKMTNARLATSNELYKTIVGSNSI